MASANQQLALPIIGELRRAVCDEISRARCLGAALQSPVFHKKSEKLWINDLTGNSLETPSDDIEALYKHVQIGSASRKRTYNELERR